MGAAVSDFYPFLLRAYVDAINFAMTDTKFTIRKFFSMMDSHNSSQVYTHLGFKKLSTDYELQLKHSDSFDSLRENNSPYFRRFRKRLIKKIGGQCQQCGQKEDLQVHHINCNPINNEVKNIQILCRKCHRLIHRAGFRKRAQKSVKRLTRWRDIEKQKPLAKLLFQPMEN